MDESNFTTPVSKTFDREIFQNLFSPFFLRNFQLFLVIITQKRNFFCSRIFLYTWCYLRMSTQGFSLFSVSYWRFQFLKTVSSIYERRSLSLNCHCMVTTPQNEVEISAEASSRTPSHKRNRNEYFVPCFVQPLI